MEYRELGRTGLRVSAVGLGTEYLNGQPRDTVKAVVAEAAGRGVNYVDIIFSFADYLDNLGAALAGRRDGLTIALHLGCAETDGQYRRSRDVKECRANFEDMLRRLGTDHADVIVVQNCDEPEDYRKIMGAGGLLELAEQLRQEGKGRFLGFSGHTVPVPTRAAKSGRYGVLMLSINAREGSQERREFCQLCAREQIGLVAMKPFAGGAMLNAQAGAGAPTPAQCLSFVLSQPGVCTAVPGMKNVEELEAALRYLDGSEEERDFSALVAEAGWNAAGACTYCNHCTPCPQGIAIGQVIRLLDLSAHGMTESLQAQYRAPPGAPASDCIACGECRERCPFGVDTPERIRQAGKAFEGWEPG
ncbi:MAG: aldo/keto reductase [Armatimonadota bacterium]